MASVRKGRLSEDDSGGHVSDESRGIRQRWFNNAKGYGFLGSEDGPDVFIHFSSIESGGYKSLKEGEPVEFDVVTGEKGRPQADKVRRAAAETAA